MRQGDYIAANELRWKSAKHASQSEATLNTYAYPVIGKLPVKGIEVAHVMKVIQPIWETRD